MSNISVEKIEPMSLSSFVQKFEQIIPMIDEVLPKSTNVAAFKAGLMFALSKNNDCLAASFQSLQVVILHAARCGVIIDGRESAIAYFYDKTVGAKVAKFYLMVDGVKKLFHAAGFRQFDALPVYKGDVYRVWNDESGAHFKHDRSAPDERGGLRFYYAYVITKEGELFHEEMSLEEIANIRKMAAKDHVWAANFGEQARKTLFHRIAKRVKRCPELIHFQNEIESEFDFKDVTPQSNHSKMFGEAPKPPQSPFKKDIIEEKPVDHFSPEWEAKQLEDAESMREPKTVIDSPPAQEPIAPKPPMTQDQFVEICKEFCAKETRITELKKRITGAKKYAVDQGYDQRVIDDLFDLFEQSTNNLSFGG